MQRLLLSLAITLTAVSTITAAAVAQSAQEPASVPATPVASPAAPAQSAPTAAKPAKPPSGPTDSKAKETFEEGKKLEKSRKYVFALDNFRKADKQDGGKCIPCELRAYTSALEIRDFKAAREEASAILEHVTSDTDKAQAHALMGNACLVEGVDGNHEKPLEAADEEFQVALKIAPNKSDCMYSDGVALAHLKRDGEARERFQQFLKAAPATDIDYDRAQRFAEHPELARARVAPNFRFTTLDGKTMTLESLTGKVVLIDFWATWCGPCREALPRVQKIAEKFQGQPFVVVSISLDRDEAKWKDFVAAHGMTWTQYRDGYFNGPVATTFGVKAIPATFTIDADGVLQDQHVGDADIEGKIRKLIARANEVASRKAAAGSR
jgi:thiol-disulfide isomerase/thioredoxin